MEMSRRNPFPSRTRAPLHKRPPVSWWHLIVELERHGYSCRLVGDVVGRGTATVNGWKNLDAEPKHVDGVSLIELWAAVTGKGEQDLPRKTCSVLSAAAFKG